MNQVNKLIEQLSTSIVLNHKYVLVGNHKQGNIEMKKMLSVFKDIKKLGGMEDLLQLINSDIPEIAVFAASMCLKYNPEKCLPILERFAHQDIRITSSEAGQVLKYWQNGTWNLG